MLLLAIIEQLNFKTLKILKGGFNTTLNLIYWAYKPCLSEFCVSKEKGHLTISNREESRDCNNLT